MAIKVVISVIEGEGHGDECRLKKAQTVVGRGKSDFRLKDAKVSGSHMRLIMTDTQLFLEDLGSTNGTFVNDKRVFEKCELKNLDEIALGFSRLRVNIVESLTNNATDNVKAEAVKAKKPRKKKTTTKKSDSKTREKTEQKLDISEMIEEELRRFSRWDLVPSEKLPELDQGLNVPKIDLFLEVVDGPEKGRRIKIEKGNTVLGRSKSDVRFRDADVSRNHASIEAFSDSQFFIRDLASTNGTFVNDEKVTYQKIKDGDIIQIGATVLKFMIDSAVA